MYTYRLQEPNESYEEQALSYIREFHEYDSNINGTGGLHHYENDYPGWLSHLAEMRTVTISEERVPSETYFLVRNEDNYIVGMINIRLALNETLRVFGGHIGYSIRPTERRQGLNLINLYLGLEVCQRHNISVAYLDCTATNIGSMRTILSLGGIYDYAGIDPYDNELTIVYHINVDESLERYRDNYAQPNYEDIERRI